MTDKQTRGRIIIVGGGMVGMVLAKLLSAQDFQISLVEAADPPRAWQPGGDAAKVSALNVGSINVLKAIGAWQRMPKGSHGLLRSMQVWDDLGGGEIVFDSATMARPCLGAIVENNALISTLRQLLSQDERVDLMFSQPARAIDDDASGVTLHTGESSLHGDLLVAADGARSWVRTQYPFACHERTYQQHAIVANIEAKHPHRHRAYQAFLPTGPLGLLPLAESNQYSIVWSCQPSGAQTLLTMSSSAFEYELTNALQCRLGTLRLLGERKEFPLVARYVRRPFIKRCLLIGDAAHTVHPLAGQGANLGLLDAAWLSERLSNVTLTVNQRQLNRHLQAYLRTRLFDHKLMVNLMRLFCEGFTSQASWQVNLRSGALQLTDRAGSIKTALMQMLANDSDDAPVLARCGQWL